MNPTFDDKDRAILSERQARWDAIEGPRVGDWCSMPNGELRRFTHDWGDSLQTTTPKFGLGSFYFGPGYMSYSGALDPCIPKAKFLNSGQTRLAHVWFFHHDQSGAHRGVYCKAVARVYCYDAGAK